MADRKGEPARADRQSGADASDGQDDAGAAVAARRVRESAVRVDGCPAFHHPDWSDRFPGLVQGITGRADPDGLEPGLDRDRLASALDMPGVVSLRQVHGSATLLVDGRIGDGSTVLGDGDAIVSERPGVLLTLNVADCIPIYAVEPGRRLAGVAHAGWRGLAAGVVESLLRTVRGLGVDPADLWFHLGPSICGRCYEVGPEVPRTLGLRRSVDHVDLRGVAVRRLLEAGVRSGRVSRSGWCTLCHHDRFVSYRGGDEGLRMIAFLGWKET